MNHARKFFPVTILVIAMIALTVAASGCSSGKKTDYPAKSVELLLPYSTGGSMDNVTRGIQPYLQKVLGVSVVVTNMPGASGIIGMNKVYDGTADGYTVLIASNASVVYTRLYSDQTHFGSDMLKAFTPVYAWLNGDANALTVNKDAPYKTVDDLAAKAKKDGVTIGISGGIGSTDHQTVLMIINTYGGNWKVVPFASGGENAAALLGKHIDASMIGIAGAADPTKFRLLAHTGATKIPTLPDVPTFSDLGKDIVVGYHVGAFLKKGTDQSIVKKLEQSFDTAAKDPGFKKWAQDAKSPIGDPWDAKTFSDFLVGYTKGTEGIIPTLQDAVKQAQGAKK